MDEAIRKAQVLIEALGWIRRFRGRYVVIKLGGSALEDPETVSRFLTDLIFMETVGMKPILIHGGGKAISRAMSDAGIEPRFVHGRRYTDAATLKIVARVLAEEICESLVSGIEQQGGLARGLHFNTENALIAEPLLLRGSDGEPIDVGRVGTIIGLNKELIDRTLADGQIPVLPSVALMKDGQKINVNADTAASAIAQLLKAEKLVFLSDVPGIFLDRQDPDSLVSHLERSRCHELIDDGTIDTGMIPKIEAALESLAAGVGKVHVIDGRMPHSVLLEIYSDTGVGTEIVR